MSVSVASVTEIPFHGFRPGLPLVGLPVHVDEQGPFHFILDTGNGAAPFLFSQALAERLGIAAVESADFATPYSVGDGERPRILAAEVGSIRVGDRVSRGVRVGVSSVLDDLGKRIGAALDGNLGYGFLKDYRVTVDYLEQRVRLASGPEPQPDGGVWVPFELGAKKPLVIVPVRINGHGPFLFAVDTGAGSSLLAPALAERLGLAAGTPIPLLGGAGTAAGYLSTVDTFEIGALRLSGLSLVVSDFFRTLSQAVGTEIEGAIGWDVLAQFRVTFDYPGGRLGLAT